MLTNEFNLQFHLWFFSGYVMPWKAAECIYKRSLEIPFLHWEDIFITGFAATACQVIEYLYQNTIN